MSAPSSEKRSEPRHVVDGLTAEFDGEAREILDISASGIRLWREPSGGACAVCGTLHLASEAGFPSVEFTCVGWLERVAPDAVVYRYEAPIGGWSVLLSQFDSFLNTALPLLEET